MGEVKENLIPLHKVTTLGFWSVFVIIHLQHQSYRDKNKEEMRSMNVCLIQAHFCMLHVLKNGRCF